MTAFLLFLGLTLLLEAPFFLGGMRGHPRKTRATFWLVANLLSYPAVSFLFPQLSCPAFAAPQKCNKMATKEVTPTTSATLPKTTMVSAGGHQQMQIQLTTTKTEAMAHIKSLMKNALTGQVSDRANYSKLNSHYGAISSLQGETVEELFDGVSAAADKSHRTSEVLDRVGTAGLIVMILGMCLTGITSLGLAFETILTGLVCFLVGGFGSAIAGNLAEENESLVDHLDWLCTSGSHRMCAAS